MEFMVTIPFRVQQIGGGLAPIGKLPDRGMVPLGPENLKTDVKAARSLSFPF